MMAIQLEVRIVRSRFALMMAVPALLLNLACGSDTSSSPNPVPPGGGGSTPPTTTPAAPNQPPTAQIVDRSPKTNKIVVGGTNFAVHGAGTDPDGDSLTYTWSWGDGSDDTTGKGSSHIYLKEGTFRVELTVTDGRGGKATDHTSITAQKLSGTWNVSNARHFPLSININQNSGPGVFGLMSDGAQVQGQVRDPFTLQITVTAANGFCIPSGTYTGSINTSLTEVTFPGVECQNFTFTR
jgi:hypothetical protein